MQLPDSGCEVIKTLQYYESSPLPTAETPQSFPKHVTLKIISSFMLNLAIDV